MREASNGKRGNAVASLTLSAPGFTVRSLLACLPEQILFRALYRHGVYPLRAFCFPINKGDHCFLVIVTGVNEVVCDPWANAVYRSSHFPEQMRRLYGGNPPDLKDLEVLCEVHDAESDQAEASPQPILRRDSFVSQNFTRQWKMQFPAMSRWLEREVGDGRRRSGISGAEERDW